MARLLINGNYKTFTGIKEATGDAQHSNQYYRIYCNYDSGEIWCNEYTSCNSWSEYHDNNIINILSGNGNNSIFGLTQINMEDVKQAITQSFREWEFYKNFSETEV